MNCNREHDFALIIAGVPEFTERVENALFEAGCDDATFSIQYGQLHAEFSREAESLKEAILSAIADVRKADIGAEVLQVDDCNLVTQSDIARRIGRSRQLVHQYITGQRGPGNFPAPMCGLREDQPLWAWCAVSHWLAANNLIRAQVQHDALVVAVINNALEGRQQEEQDRELVKEIAGVVAGI
jgi:hypothetical protein